MDSNAPRGKDWADIVEALHLLSNTMTVRSHYPDGHPAIRRADDLAGAAFVSLLERLPELVVAIVDGELVISERPFPDLRERLHVLTDAMLRHEIECIVFQRGLRPLECGRLGRALASPADAPGRVRETVQSELPHVLLRFAALRERGGGKAAGTSATWFVPRVAAMLGAASGALAEGRAIDVAAISALAKEILHCCAVRTFVLIQRSWTHTPLEAAAHATNVAMITGAMAVEAKLPETLSIDLTAAALVHDIGHLLLSAEIAGLPEPLLDERQRPLFRNHTFAGASSLMAAGAPPLWIAAALEHHRGVDGGGYPMLESPTAPHELVRMIGLANFFDRKWTLLQGRSDTPEEILQQALALEERYFGRPLVERFVRALGVHPPGTTVELSDRQPALVLAADRNDPWRPRVMLLRGPKNGMRVDLTELNPSTGLHHLSIVRAIPPPLFVLDDAVVDDASAVVAPAIEAGSGAARALGDVLDDIVIAPKRSSNVSSSVLVTSPPGPPSAPPRPMSAPPLVRSAPPEPTVYRSTRPPPPEGARYSSRPGSVEEVVAVPRRLSVAPPPDAAASKAASLAIPPPPLERGPLATKPLARVPRHTGTMPATLDHRGGFILTFVDGVSTVEDIIDASGLPKDEVLSILEELATSATIVFS